MAKRSHGKTSPMSEGTERVIYIRVSEELAERIEDVRYWARVPSVVAFGREALTRECERLEREHNKGKRFVARP